MVGLIVLIATVYLSLQAQAADALIGTCKAEVGIVMPNVGTYIQATSDRNYYLRPSQCLVSSNRAYMAILQIEDGNFVVYDATNITPGGARWSTVTGGYPKAELLVQQDGHFVVYRAGAVKQESDGRFNADPRKQLFVSNKEKLPYDNYFLIMQDDGGLGLYRGSNPANQLGLVFGAKQLAIESSYCANLRRDNVTVLKKSDITTTNPVLAAGAAQVLLLEFNKKPENAASQAIDFIISTGKCSR